VLAVPLLNALPGIPSQGLREARSCGAGASLEASCLIHDTSSYSRENVFREMCGECCL
jgi:hypothetical protein